MFGIHALDIRDLIISHLDTIPNISTNKYIMSSTSVRVRKHSNEVANIIIPEPGHTYYGQVYLYVYYSSGRHTLQLDDPELLNRISTIIDTIK